MNKIFLVIAVFALTACKEVNVHALQQDQLCRGMIRSYLQLNGFNSFSLRQISDDNFKQSHTLNYQYQSTSHDVDMPNHLPSSSFSVQCKRDQKQLLIDFSQQSPVIRTQLRLSL